MIVEKNEQDSVKLFQEKVIIQFQFTLQKQSSIKWWTIKKKNIIFQNKM